MGGQVTFFLNSTSNLSSNGWKLPAEGVNESCMSEPGEGGGGGWQAWRSWQGAGERGLYLRGAVRHESGGHRQSSLPMARRLWVGGSLSTSLSAHRACRIRVEGRLHSPLLIAKWDLRQRRQSGAGAGPRHPSLRAVWLASGLSRSPRKLMGHFHRGHPASDPRLVAGLQPSARWIWGTPKRPWHRPGFLLGHVGSRPTKPISQCWVCPSS